jgi:hypothetical protein
MYEGTSLLEPNFIGYQTEFWDCPGKTMMIGIVILAPNSNSSNRYKWVLVTMAWRVLRLRLEEQPPVWMVAVNILNMQSQRADKGWSSSLGLGKRLKTPHSENVSLLQSIHRQDIWYFEC